MLNGPYSAVALPCGRGSEYDVEKFTTSTSTVRPSKIRLSKCILVEQGPKMGVPKRRPDQLVFAVMQTKMLLRYGWIVVSLLLASGCSRNAKSYLQSAKKYFDAGKYEDAIILYKKAIQKRSEEHTSE